MAVMPWSLRGHISGRTANLSREVRSGPVLACPIMTLAYTDKRCYGHTREEMGKDVPPAGNDFLSQREVDAVVKYLFAKGGRRVRRRT